MLSDAYCNGIVNLKVFGDSKLIISFMDGNFEAQSSGLVGYVATAKILSSRFSKIYYEHIGRSYNYEADHLARSGAKRYSIK